MATDELSEWLAGLIFTTMDVELTAGGGRIILLDGRSTDRYETLTIRTYSRRKRDERRRTCDPGRRSDDDHKRLCDGHRST